MNSLVLQNSLLENVTKFQATSSAIQLYDDYILIKRLKGMKEKFTTLEHRPVPHEEDKHEEIRFAGENEKSKDTRARTKGSHPEDTPSSV